MDLFTLKQNIMESAEAGAAAIMKLQNPKSDDLTQRQAYEFAGEGWIDHHTRNGNLKPVRMGKAPNSPRVYSRLEIIALKQAEKLGATIKTI